MNLAPEDQLRRLSRERWDAVVVGSGAGAGAFLWRLAQRRPDARVLVLEKGPDRRGRRQRVADEVASCRRDEFVPYVADDPHVVDLGDGPKRSYEGWTSVCVGGGTVHMGAMLFRMHPEDFDPVRRYGAPPGTTLADWPFGYDALRPYYDVIQTALGLSGDTASNPFEPAGAALPYGTLPSHPIAAAFDASARAAGLHPYAAPRGILPPGTRAAAGRSGCVECGFCGGFDCPVGAKASSPTVFLAGLPKSFVLIPGAPVVALEEGRVIVAGSTERHAFSAPQVVLGASAVESARLLLLSRSAAHPAGLGNHHGQIGAHLVTSFDTSGRATFALPDPRFPLEAEARCFVSRALQDRYTDTGAYPKAGTLFVEREPMNPVQRSLRVARSGPLGAALVQRLREAFLETRALLFETFAEHHPTTAGHVRLDDAAVDSFALPSARITLPPSPAAASRCDRLSELFTSATEALRPTRVETHHTARPSLFLQAGTLRMGANPERSATDSNGRVHGVPWLTVVDGGALPTMGGVPPTFTIMANAARIADLWAP